MVSSEVESLARTGGLGDAVEALSRALASLGADVVIVTPKYRVTRVPAGARPWSRPVVAPLGLGHARELGVLEARLPVAAVTRGGSLRVCMLGDSQLFERGGVYGDHHGAYRDNVFRFAAMCSGALAVAERAWDGALPDVLHAHDWHAALSILYARQSRGTALRQVPSVLTIHNLAFQGTTSEAEIDVLGIAREGWDKGWLRHDGQVNLIKGAIELADRVTTVSETYAREIQRPPSGHGLDAHIRWHRDKLTGIVNGIDTASFDPSTDAALARRYGPGDAIEGKRACKRALEAELGLGAEPDEPLLGLVSRLEAAKGVDLFLSVLPTLVERGARVACVGTGQPALEDALRAAAARWPGRVAARIVFDPALARRLFAAADFIVVPSREEPCGLTQMYAMRYGAVPIVTPVGGLRDTVEPVDVAHAAGTGIIADSAGSEALLFACEEALWLWRDPVGMASVMSQSMARDSSWVTSAEKIRAIYADLSGHKLRTQK